MKKALILALLAAGAVGGEKLWQLDFSYRHPKRIAIDHPVEGLVYYWYIVCTVKNPDTEDHPLNLRLWILTDKLQADNKTPERFDEGVYPDAEKLIQEQTGKAYPNFLRAPEVLKAGESFEFVSVFKNVNPDARKITLCVKGLTRALVVDMTSDTLECEEFVMKYYYDFPGPSFKPPDLLVFKSRNMEKETRKIQLTDLPTKEKISADKDEMDATFKKLMARVQEVRKAPTAEKQPTPPKPQPEAVAPPEKKVQPEWLGKLLRQIDRTALSLDDFRVKYESTIELPTGKLRSEGTICFKQPDLLRIEREVGLGGGQTMKDLRIFDGKTFWLRTETPAGGTSVKKWSRANVRKDWVTVEGYQEFGFRELINPALSWLGAAPDVVAAEKKDQDGETVCVLRIEGSEVSSGWIRSPLAPDFLGFIPRNTATVFVDLKTGLPKQLEIGTPGGRHALVQFKTRETNLGLAPDLFVHEATRDAIDMDAAQ